MQDAIRVLAGDCSVRYRADDDHERRGSVVVLVKPDNTVLVHDADGYQPAAWLTRADTVRYARDGDGFALVAASEGERLRVESHEEFGHAHYPASPAGPPVGDCPDCGATLVRDGGRVVCTGCLTAYTIPRDADVLAETCGCGLPRMSVERGAEFVVCVDRTCESIDDAVRERFDGAWPCPDCGSGLRIERERGLRAVCEECERRLRVPVGTVVDTCECGLPRFAAADGSRCLDPDCAAA